ncbi:MAG: hypothetical protein JWL77_332 [Chthonomonadaceae bacterium]|nr:hypothetical protein [Chthonomonadaceae bacterium]
MADLNRRAFVRGAAAAGLIAAGLPTELQAAERKTRVVVVTCPDVIDKDKPVVAGAVRRMMEAGITRLAGTSDVSNAWKTFIKPSDHVALADAGTWLMNVPEVLVEVMRGITLASPSAAKLTYCALDESHLDFMGKLREGLKAASIPQEVLDGSIYTIRSKYHEQAFTNLVMTPTLKSHTIAGVSGIIKHFATMSKGGPAPHHANAMETAGSVIVPEFGHMKQLYIVDALRFGETTRGPQYYQKSLIFGTDPVATDMIALEVFLKSCKTHGELPPDHHRMLADTRYKAGISDRSKIEVVDMKV